MDSPKRRRTLALLVTIALLPLATPAFAEAPAASDRIVVMISVDGLASFYMDDPQVKMPTIRQLAKEGAWAPVQASAPTVTWPNHTNLVTGTTSAQHGVVGNNYFDRQTQQPVALILDPLFDKEQIVRAPTIYDAAKQAGLTTAAIRWPATRNAKNLDWQLPETGSAEQLRRFTTPQLLAECQEAKIWSDGVVMGKGDKQVQIIADETALNIFKHVLTTHRPNLALLHLIEVDAMEHNFGPKSFAAYMAIAKADREVREVWELLQREFPGKATLLVVSDHGFSKIEHHILPNVVLRNLQLCQVEGDKVTGGSVRVVVQGGAAMIYILDDANRAAIIERLRKHFGEMPGVAKVAGPGELKDHGLPEPSADPHAPDMVLFAADGYAFNDKASGDSPSLDNPEQKGTHGHDEHLPILRASFIGWGAGIQPGGRAELVNNTDIAPTIAALLGLKFDQATGKPISEALAK